ncbi:Synaptic vesicle proteinlike [Caligus rogercresseyi]|uniref:Synaptic vesicle proteinlike n=1 Tax=Caligus rogercresseyi TaxID=217165 RepID=A0A7T8KC86_CALRO|nr:Synaptic vesicle proteinlike [Caligus rogercresseyi]
MSTLDTISFMWKNVKNISKLNSYYTDHPQLNGLMSAGDSFVLERIFPSSVFLESFIVSTRQPRELVDDFMIDRLGGNHKHGSIWNGSIFDLFSSSSFWNLGASPAFLERFPPMGFTALECLSLSFSRHI